MRRSFVSESIRHENVLLVGRLIEKKISFKNHHAILTGTGFIKKKFTCNVALCQCHTRDPTK